MALPWLPKEPAHMAPSMRWKASSRPPASHTAMFILAPIWLAFSMAPAITRLASARVRVTRSILLVDQAVELAGVLAGDLVGDVGRQVAELLGDVFSGIRPDAVGMRVVGAPHQGFDAHVLDQLGADAVVLERGAALPAPVFARQQLHLDV